MSVGFADEQKTLTSRDYKKLFSQRFNSINKAIISDDEGKALLKLIFSNNGHKLKSTERKSITILATAKLKIFNSGQIFYLGKLISGQD